ncbi:MAG TPA: serine hydrolase [Beutenbergiaceae bacterium]|nr:serine hydrolase [Beutenbergiaceae bacterium]
MDRWAPPVVAELELVLHALAEENPGQWAFSIREDGRPIVSVDGDRVVPAASTSKVALLVLALQQVATSGRDLADRLQIPRDRVGGSGVLRALTSVHELTLAEVLELMVVVSDNVATNMIIDALGVRNIRTGLRDLGAQDSRLERRLMDSAAIAAGAQNVTTADDQALVLDRLCRGELLPDPLRSHALAVLGGQQFNDRLPSRLESDVVCRHKTGEIYNIRHDVGILEFDGRQIAVAALGSDLPEPADNLAAQVIGTAAQGVVALARGEQGWVRSSSCE